VEDSFAKSILYGFTVAAESNGHVLVDATEFSCATAKERGTLCAPAPIGWIARAAPCTWTAPKGFPKNTEVEVTLTFFE